MAAYNKFNVFVGNVGTGVHNLNTHTLKLYLTNSAPNATMATKSQLAEITAGNGYTAGGADVQNAYSQSGGTGTLTGVDVTWTATGTIGPFRYAVLYNDTPTSPADPLIAWWDIGSSITLNNGDTFTADIGASLLTLV